MEEVLSLGDIDFSTGNITFNGNVIIKGIVNNGFAVTANGDIDCSELIEGANLTAGGSIHVKRGVKGLGKSVIKAGKDVFAKYIERATVIAGGSVIVDEALIHSDTEAGDRIEATGAKGSIFGGHVAAGNLVKANFIGSEMAIKTIIEVGAAPQMKDRLVFLNREVAKKNDDYDKAQKNIQILTELKKTGRFPYDGRKCLRRCRG